MEAIITECYINVYGVRPTAEVIQYVSNDLSPELKEMVSEAHEDDSNTVEALYDWMTKRTTFM